MLRPILEGLDELVQNFRADYIRIISTMDFDAKLSPQHWRLQDILLYRNNKSKRDTAGNILLFHPYIE